MQIVKLLQGVRKISDERKERFPSKCALFVCNKWDTVPENEKQQVKEHVIKKLSGQCSSSWSNHARLPNLDRKNERNDSCGHRHKATHQLGVSILSLAVKKWIMI